VCPIHDSGDGLGLPLRLGEQPLFIAVVKAARLTGKDYTPPKKDAVGGDLLDTHYNEIRKENDKHLLTEADVYGMQVLGDGETIKKDPLFNVLAATRGSFPTLLAVHDCSDHMAQGGKKDAWFISKVFREEMEKLDPMKDRFDLYIVDGASNVQAAGEIISSYFPRVSTVHGSEHLVSLIFSDIAKIPVVRVSSSLSGLWD